jgi:hypothetical protein
MAAWALRPGRDFLKVGFQSLAALSIHPGTAILADD